jgi:protein-S-isoprenylcysteine O-methyltransferase Ste14
VGEAGSAPSDRRPGQPCSTWLLSGPYHYVRHPAYLGAILYELAVAVLLASWWALLVSGLSTILLIRRTALKDRALQAELSGYGTYARQVRYRLLPGVW